MNKLDNYYQIEDPSYQLKSTQEWFSGIITQKLEKNQSIRPYSPKGMLIAEEASKYVVPSPTLKPHQRMQIYNQQYWWRLLKTLHDNYPMVTRLFGTHVFNEKIGIPYLLTYPPNHWSLNYLGERLPKWIIESYHERDQKLVLNAAQLDLAFLTSFIAPQLPVPNFSKMAIAEPEKLLSQPFYLQPFIHLFSWEYDLFTFRSNFLKESTDYWIDHRFPKLKKGKTFYFILFRKLNNNLAYREIGKEEFLFLNLFKKGIAIQEACAYMEEQESSVYETVAANMQKWIQEWSQSGWLTFSSPHTED